jgi:hypothetical protein
MDAPYISINDNKISKFRDLVNSNSGYVCNTFCETNGKNQWNVICSCMDWLTVSIRYLQNMPELDKNIDVRVMQMFSLISAIDLVSESITQLHRVFVNSKTLPFATEKECFSDRLFNEDDNTYFKSIRASFGAHPVNLNQSGSRRFASWPFDSHINIGELTVHLYSLKVGEDDLVMNLNPNELIKFLIKRYQYLDLISEKIIELYSSFKNNLAKQLIEIKSDPLEQLYVLRNESEKRLDNDYYKGVIDDLIMIFEAELLEFNIEATASEYKKSLVPLIEEIKINLQEMNIVDLKHGSLLEPRSDLKRVLNYELGKFYSWLHADKYDPMAQYYLNRFNKETNCKFNFNINDPINSLFIKVKLMLLN